LSDPDAFAETGSLLAVLKGRFGTATESVALDSIGLNAIPVASECRRLAFATIYPGAGP